MNYNQLKINKISDYCVEYDGKLILPAHPVLNNPRSNSQFAILVPVKIIDEDYKILDESRYTSTEISKDKIKTIYLLFNGNHYFFSKIRNNKKPELIIVDKVIDLSDEYSKGRLIKYITNINQLFEYYYQLNSQIFKNRHIVDEKYLRMYDSDIKPMFAFNSLLLLINLKKNLKEYYGYGRIKIKKLIEQINELTIDICGDIGCSYTEDELIIHLNNLLDKIRLTYCWDGNEIGKEVRINDSYLQLLVDMVTKRNIEAFIPGGRCIYVYLYSDTECINDPRRIFEKF